MAVTNLLITSRQPFAQGRAFGAVGAYEQLDGIAYFAVDPKHASNHLITDIERAPRDTGGRVPFSADVRILRPVAPQGGNQRLLVDIPNRGRGLALRNLNSAPDVAPGNPLHPGNGFLMQQGYTVVACACQHDVPNVPGLLRLHVPEAFDADGPISGKLVVTFQLNAPAVVHILANGPHRPHPAHDLDDPEAVLTEQDDEDAPERIIPRHQWSFARLHNDRVVPDASHVYLASGFQPGKVYQVIYTTTGAPVGGLGLLATRDLVAFLKYATAADNPCAGKVEYAYTLGVSQSGRFLRHFLYLGLNQDERDRMVFDGLIPHVAGGKHGEFNHRFAQPGSQASRSPNNLFPFSDVVQTDPETGRSDGVLVRLTAAHRLPKVMHTYTSSEYWAGHGALVHIDMMGRHDLEVPESVRIYHFGGSQHGLGNPPLKDTDAGTGIRAQYPFNWTEYRPLLRAALVNLDRWVTHGEVPPASRYPRLDDGTAVPPGAVLATLEKFPGVKHPAPLRRFFRFDFGPESGIATYVPPRVGAPYPCLVPAVDADGNEQCGILLPYQTVPLATYTGWNLRHADIGGAGQILASGGASGGTLLGATIPFAPTPAIRQAAADPRPSIAERYTSKESYLAQVDQAAQALVEARYLLAEDVAEIRQQASWHYDLLAGESA